METFYIWLEIETLLENRATEEVIASFEQAISTRHPGAINDFMERVRPYIVRIVASRIKDANDREDIVQKTQLNLYRVIIGELAGIQDPKKILGFVKTVALRVGYNHFRRTNREIPSANIEPLARSQPEKEENPMRDYLHSALASLGEMDKEVVALKYFQGLSIEEIAAKLSIPTGTVKRRLFTARQRLGKEIERLKAA